MEKDKYSEKRFDIQKERDIDVSALEAIPFDYAGSDTEVVYETEEFTCVCPWTGLPDFGLLTISYVPNKSLIELKSLKYYLTSYRNVGIIQEHAVNRILKDLVKLVKPFSMTVDAEYRERGGIKSYATANWDKKIHSSLPPRKRLRES
jgi:7-cyano-7-deazaguanine reductase